MKKILVYGDATLDIFIEDRRSIPAPGTEEFIPEMPTAVGGGAALMTLGLAKLGCRVSFGGFLSSDMPGQMIVSTMKSLGVDMSATTVTDSCSTAISLSFTNEKDRAFLSYAGPNAMLDITKLPALSESYDHVHITGYTGRRDHEKYLAAPKEIKRRPGVTTSFDVAYDETGEWYKGITELMQYIDVFFMNEVEACGYSGKTDFREAAEYFAPFGHHIVVKAGSTGSLCKVNGHDAIFVPANKVKAVDTTGAGDSFNAGFICGFTEGLSLDQSLRLGNFCGGRSVTAKGGNTAFPFRKEAIELGLISSSELL